MMWFSRKEFDRNAWFYTDADVRGGLHWDAFCNMELPVPDIEKQKSIVKEYNTIVNRIKLNEQLNQKLEETAQAIYKEWFVDFEFPDDNGKPYKSSGGEMECNAELDIEMPSSWAVTPIEEIILVKDGTHDSPKPATTGYPLITSTHLGPYSVYSDDAYLISEADYEDVNRRSRVERFDILFSMIGTVGTISFVLKEQVDFAIKNVGLFKTSAIKKYANYLLFHLKSSSTTQYIQTCLLGSTQNYITLTELRNIPFLVPDANTLEQYNIIIQQIVENLKNVTEETNILIDLQNTSDEI